MPTGETDAGCIESYAENPTHWVANRPREVGRHWEEQGTWLRPPLLIDRIFLDPATSGLQVLEGRTRVGVLRGRRREQLGRTGTAKPVGPRVPVRFCGTAAPPARTSTRRDCAVGGSDG